MSKGFIIQGCTSNTYHNYYMNNTDYYAGTTYQYQGEIFASLCPETFAKIYKSEKVANKVAKRLEEICSNVLNTIVILKVGVENE